jgi:type IV pilus assembly protein PilM
MARQQTTLYIDDAAIHVMVSKGRQPSKWATVPLEHDLVKDGVVQDQSAVAVKLTELWQSLKLGRSKDVVVGLSGVNCLYQLFVLPELPDNLLPEAMAREASHNLGIEIEQVYLSWQVLGVEHGQMRVYLTVISREMVDGLLATLKEAGLKPYVMDVKPLCLARCSSEPRAVMVDTQPGSFDVVVLADGVPEVVRSLSFPEEASAGEKTALIRGELERAIVFFNSAHMDKPIDLTVPILVSGEIARQEGEWEVLRGPREREVRVLLSPMAEAQDFDSAMLVTNIGLALKEILTEEEGALAYSIVNFNALPGAYVVRKRSLAESVWLPVAVGGIILVAAGIGLCVYTQGQNNALADDVKSVEERIAEQKLAKKDIDALTAQVSAAQTSASNLEAALTGWAVDRDIFAGDLVQVYASLPAGVDLQSIARAETAVNVNGTADDEVCLFDYAWSLEESGRFTSVVVTSITLADGSVSFNIVLAGMTVAP